MDICVEFGAHFYGCLYPKKNLRHVTEFERVAIIIISSDVERFLLFAFEKQTFSIDCKWDYSEYSASKISTNLKWNKHRSTKGESSHFIFDEFALSVLLFCCYKYNDNRNYIMTQRW